MAQITWKLTGQEEAYEHFEVPFILATNALYSRIRNIQIRLQPADQLIPREIPKYDRKVVLEALHNCIAHQDYRLQSRVIVTERPNKLEFESAGGFFRGEPEDYVLRERTPNKYRNPLLVAAMSRLNMIDTMGYGIKRMYRKQAERYLPLPDYAIDAEQVTLTVYGAVIDAAYTELLMEQTGLRLDDVLALDRIQKGLAIGADTAKRLRDAKLVEGRRPNLRVCARIAKVTGTEIDYVKNAFDSGYYRDLTYNLVDKFGPVHRDKVRELLWDKLPETLTDVQKETKIKNLLSRLRIHGRIKAVGKGKNAEWTVRSERGGGVNRKTRTE